MTDDLHHAESTMTRRTALAGAGGLGLALAARGLSAAAQESTPLTEPVGIEGVDLGSGQPTSIPEMELVLRRTTIAPGGGIPPHSHPGSLLLVVDAGTFGYTPLGGTTQLTRAAVAGTPAPVEEVPIGTEVLLTKGDALFLEDPQDTIRNAGEDDVVLLLATLTPVGEDFTTLLDDEGTPPPP